MERKWDSLGSSLKDLSIGEDANPSPPPDSSSIPTYHYMAGVGETQISMGPSV